MRKRAVCIGINDYPGSGVDLSGCVNDALAWRRVLDAEGYEVELLQDEEATRENVVMALNRLVQESRWGDRIAFTYSGHGSWVPDLDADEEDARDECLVLHDWQDKGYLLDDELHYLWEIRRWGVRVVTISDSCHSGTMQRLVNPNVTASPRYFPPEWLRRRTIPRRMSVNKPPRRPIGTMLLSGCADNEVSYDAWFDGWPQGAFSRAAQMTWEPGIRMGVWHERIRERLPSSDYNQTPQMQASRWQRSWTL